MLQDILPHVYHSEYKERKPDDGDILILQKGNELLLTDSTDLPTLGQIRSICPEAAEKAFYLFSIDEQGYYALPLASIGKDSSSLSDADLAEGHFSWKNVLALRETAQGHHSFGGAVGWQLASWYDLHRFCGRCGHETVHSGTERAILCPKCKHAYYPRISPVVIIAIVDGDRILLTRYNRSGYRRHALVAGFVEVGETFEDAVRREVMEEVGLRVKNIHYIESQPWPFSSSLIAGFRADVDGDAAIHLNTDGGEELAEAVWVDRKDVEYEDNNISLTWDMIRKFKNGTLSG